MWLLYLLLLISLPLHEVLNVKTFFTVKLFHIFILGSACLIFIHKVAKSEKFKQSPLDIWLALFLSSYIVSLFISKDLVLGVRVIFALLFMYLAYYLTINLITTRKRLFVALKVIIITSGLVSLFGIYQVVGYLLGYDTGLVFGYEQWLFPRINVTMSEPSFFANYLLLSFGVLVSFVINRAYPLMKRKTTTIFLLLIFVALVFTLSKGVLLAALVTLPLALSGKKALLGIRTNKAVLLYGAALFLVITYNLAKIGLAKTTNYYNLGDLIGEAFLNTAGESYSQRVEFNSTAWSMFLAHPFFGVGPYNFTIRYDEYKPIWAVLSGNLNLIPNNIVLQLLAENGIMGLSIFVAMIWRIVSIVLGSLKRLVKNSSEFVMLSGLFYGFVAMTLHYMMSSSIYFPHYWVLIGLLVACSQIFCRNTSDGKGEKIV